MKKIIAMVLAVLMLCSFSISASAASKPSVGFVTFGLGGDFFQALADTFVTTMEAEGWEASYVDGEFNPSAQISAMEIAWATARSDPSDPSTGTRISLTMILPPYFTIITAPGAESMTSWLTLPKRNPLTKSSPLAPTTMVSLSCSRRVRSKHYSSTAYGRASGQAASAASPSPEERGLG